MDTETNSKSALIIYLSLHGTTRKAINVLAASLSDSGLKTDVYNLSEFENSADMDKLNKLIPNYKLIVFGSPTYFHHAPPVFTDFLKKIPDATYDQAVALLSTFGGVSSGVILYDLAKILYDKKYSLLGGMKVLTEHCLTFQEKDPFYSGHPNEKDLEEVKAFGNEIAIRVEHKNRRRFSPQAFKDKPFMLNFIDDHINKLENFKWAMPNVKVKDSLCTACGACVRNCPTNNISLGSIANHGKDCTYCYGCVRNCPTGATTAFLKPAKPTVKILAKQFNKYEDPVTQQVV